MQTVRQSHCIHPLKTVNYEKSIFKIGSLARLGNALKKTSYGLDVDSSGYTIWDGSRKVAHLSWNNNPSLDKEILKDNL